MSQRKVSCPLSSWSQVLQAPALSFQVGCEGIWELQAGVEGGLAEEQECGLVEMLVQEQGGGLAPAQCQLSSSLISLS